MGHDRGCDIDGAIWTHDELWVAGDIERHYVSLCGIVRIDRVDSVSFQNHID